MTILGLDVGDKKTGVALSDESGIIAFPLDTLTSSSDNITEIRDLIDKYNVREIVVGMPYTLSGNIGAQANRVEEFIKKLNEAINLPVIKIDERFTTQEAKRITSEHKIKSKKKMIGKWTDDALAASIILQSYLDYSR
ncbi:MAG: Holliday junction resolvase RuvX [SAR202 cluster bacterium]|nr:Holliday junction resolvase RuvX [SAR202 cluster bacterium]|tara:strand:- start:3511 stop:3924 length:414 start_codon:yes stop_codon:yes gene_type:complete